MNLNQIIKSWENNALPKDLNVLKVWKKEIDDCERQTFETWRMTSNRKTASMLTDEQLKYSEISETIQKTINNLITEQEYKAIVNRPLFTSQSAY